MARTADKAVVAYVHPVEVTASFHHSLLGLVLRDMTGPRRIGDVHAENSSANITNARNRLVRRFLATPHQWLWMIDADMAFQPDTLDRLMDSAHDRSHPIVGALCYGVHAGALFPTLYRFREEDGRVLSERYDTFPDDRLFQVHATGAACLLVHRSVLEAVEAAPDADPVYPWFQETSLNGQPVGEDVTFCLRAGKAGFPVWVDTRIRVGHQKAYVIDHAMYLQQKGAGDGADQPG